MLTSFQHQDTTYQIDFSQPLDISIPLRHNSPGPNCFYAPPFSITPVVAGDFIGDTQKGGLVNFMNVQINPHGNGTHTECVGHIAKKRYSINQCLQQFVFLAQLISVTPQLIENDHIVTQACLQNAFPHNDLQATALVIRTHPNDDNKRQQNYSGQNPPYIHHEAIQYLNTLGILHLLVDLPSVDKEEDGGQLLAHKAFWQYPQQPQLHKTITELIYVPNHIPDGMYLLNIQIAAFEMDASPSKPILYTITPTS